MSPCLNLVGNVIFNLFLKMELLLTSFVQVELDMLCQRLCAQVLLCQDARAASNPRSVRRRRLLWKNPKQTRSQGKMLLGILPMLSSLLPRVQVTQRRLTWSCPRPLHLARSYLLMRSVLKRGQKQFKIVPLRTLRERVLCLIRINLMPLALLMPMLMLSSKKGPSWGCDLPRASILMTGQA